MIEGTGRSLDSVSAHRHTAMGGDDNRIYSAALGRTGYCAEITHIGNAVEHKDKGKHTVVEERGEQGVEARVFDCRHHGNDALMILACDTVEALVRHYLHWYTGGAGFLRHLAAGVLYIYFVDGATGLNGLKHRVYAVDKVHN